MASSNPKQSIFVTGGTGFLGRTITRFLRKAHPDWKVSSYDLVEPLDADRQLDVTYIKGDILDLSQLGAALKSVEATAVIHAAGIVPPQNKRYSKELRPLTLQINVEGTRTVLSAAQAHPSVTAFVWTGSCCAVIDDFRYQYPNVDETWPTEPTQHNTVYGESKAIAEALVLQANSPQGSSTRKPFLTCSLRPSTLFGDSDSILFGGIHGLIASGQTSFVIGDALNYWDVCHADNIADAHVLAAENLLTGDKNAAGEAFFIGNEEPITFRDFCLAIWREFDHVPKFAITIPVGLASFFGIVCEWFSWIVGTEPSMRRESAYDAAAVRYANGKKAREILGYRAKLSLQDGIARSCQMFKKRAEQLKRGDRARRER